MSPREDRSLPKELQLAALAAAGARALAVPALVPEDARRRAAISPRATSARSARSRSSRPRSCSIASRCGFLVWARSRQKGFHLPGGDGVAIMLAGGWAVLLILYPGARPARRHGHPVGHVRRVRRGGRAGRRGAARAGDARSRAPEPGGRRHRLGRAAAARRASGRRTAPRATRPRSRRCCATGRRGRARSPIPRARETTRLPDPSEAPTERQRRPDDEQTQRLWEDDST